MGQHPSVIKAMHDAIDISGADLAQIPVDAVTASGSGLDPGISVANAQLQASRVAEARSLSTSTVLDLITKFTQTPNLGFVGEKWVNVLKLNLALDALST